ncbi:benzoate/H(+) symporter BenE family transporter [Comamonas odontotermitis]|uniref:benzoate/H(+) symporter BenE family transporter n=1 Tax=Comamonas odontotermitis TaxID=379895 RepID=UPI001CC52F2D|nr:benzoate/H(+) symporter BenE family transporter [Comamonas odontotermitis]UBB17584.1 benzoate/H(+) symporter BenE family transporter [Comamonas odontotermitis]
MRFFKDLSVSALVAGFVTVLVGLTSSIAVVFQAAQSFGATPAQLSSWVWALGMGVGLCCWLPSMWWRKPVVVAWSTPGAAVLATAGATGAFTMNEAIGAFVLSAALITLVGLTGWFERLMNRIPIAIASALLAGVLTRFGLDAFAAAQTNTWLVVAMLVVYLVGRRWVPRYAVMLTLAAGIVVALAQGKIQWAAVQPGLTFPIFTMPAFSLQAAISLALPLFVVTMASQNLPGVAVIRGTGYDLPISKLISITGLATLVLAPFGGYAINLAAITAAICMGPEAHPDKARRYAAAVVCGVIYVLIGCFGVVIAGLLTAFPHELVVAIAGIALLGTIGNGLFMAVQSEQYREAALITFLVTVSGVTIAGVGSAFWGVVAGSLALFVQHYGKR